MHSKVSKTAERPTTTPNAPPVSSTGADDAGPLEHEARARYISVGTEALADEDPRYANVACTD